MNIGKNQVKDPIALMAMDIELCREAGVQKH